MLQQTQMTPCTFPHPENEGELLTGYFHTWADRSGLIGNTETVLMNTVGLVEGQDGTMYVVMPEDIKFNRNK